MSSRYDDRTVFNNGDEIYFHLLEERGLKHIVQYESAIFEKLEPANVARLSVTHKIWTIGDRLYKIAAQHYGDAKYWWIVARFNGKPTESHFRVGDVVAIPGPPDIIIDLYKG
tara:strand:+ start:1048 stop:1386 length:339 start_codon:yes stop_codon:yes gene_type:complete